MTDNEFLQLVKQAKANVAPMVAREAALLVHSSDCAVHSPTCRPCSCCLETRLREENVQLRLDLERKQRALEPAVADVIAEVERQVTVEGWTPEHDDTHEERELILAAECYVQHVIGRAWVFGTAGLRPNAYTSEAVPRYWPWNVEWWKPKNPRRDLVRAAALIIAELKRMDRQAARLAAVPAEGE